MKVKIINCFNPIGFELVNYYLLNEDIHIIGIDHINHERKLFYYEMVGRNARFSFYDSDNKDKPRNKDINYIIRIDKDCLTFFPKGNGKCIEINLDNVQFTGFENRIEAKEKNYINEIEIEQFVKWVVSLPKYSNLPSKMTLFSKNMDGIYFVEAYNSKKVLNFSDE